MTQIFFYHRCMHRDSDEAVESVYRSDWGRIVATLIRLVGDFEVAEEAAQEAFTAAVDQWRSSGVPEFPLNRAVAVAMVHGPRPALAIIDALDAAGDLAGYHLLHSARADLLRRAGSTEEAAKAYLKALELVTNDSERRFLELRLQAVQTKA
jgi:predicted RNA polymerase sigma factor